MEQQTPGLDPQGKIDRQQRLGEMAQSCPHHLIKLWQAFAASTGIDPDFSLLRVPETGLIALRGRIGGGGSPFNFGEATVTRASVRLADGTVGHAMTMGRNHAKAQLAAVIDALAEAGHEDAINRTIIVPLTARRFGKERQRAAETAATKVDFFTMVRGED